MPVRTLEGGFRAIPKSGLGMSISPVGNGGLAATVSTRYTTPGQPIYNEWDATAATRQGYLGHTYVMRCVRLRAETLAGLPFRAGADPDNPSVWDPNARLAQLLGPATVGAPGGPSPDMTSRAFIIWSWIQRIVTGRMAWQCRPDNSSADDPILSLWPLVSACLSPVAAAPGLPKWFDGYVYTTPVGDLPLKDHQVVYDWRMSAEDPRQSESVLQAASLPVQLAIALDKYMWGLISRGMTANKMVVHPAFAEPSSERAWQAQFLAMFTGYDKTGSTIFTPVAPDEGESTAHAIGQVQVIDLAMKGTDAQMLETVAVAKSDINVALGVPVSLMGNASERIFSNADAEERVYWTTTAINDVEEFQDAVNLRLAPQLDPDTVGWFDLSRVASLQPPTIFQPPAITDAISLGIITADQAADLLGIPAHSAGGEDAATAPIGEVVAGTNVADTATGGRAIAFMVDRQRRTQSRNDIERGQRGMEVLSSIELPDGFGFRHRPVTTHTYRAGNAGWGIVRKPRSRIRVQTQGRRAAVPQVATEVVNTVIAMRRRREMGIRSAPKLIASGIALKAADTGRVLMLQRALDSTDPASGTFEFPGGHIEPGEDSYDAAKREWGEEVGVPLPDGNVAGSWTTPNGVYRGHVHVVPSEAEVVINPDRPTVRNPDNPKGKYQETAVWMDPDHLEGKHVRNELTATSDMWRPVIKAAQSTDAIDGTRSVLDVESWIDSNSDRLLALVQ